MKENHCLAKRSLRLLFEIWWRLVLSYLLKRLGVRVEIKDSFKSA